MSDVVVYSDGELELSVSVGSESVWLSRAQLSELFGRDIKTIGKHITNVFKEKELEKTSVVAKFATTASDGKVYNTEHYNLDVIISVGYRVKSQKGVLFRQWATKVLKDYIHHGYTINQEKITQQRLLHLEQDVDAIKSHIKNNTLEVKQGIFYNGEIFDAYAFLSDLIQAAKKSIVLIDNYVDDSVLTLLSKNPNVKTTVYTHTISKQLKLDIEKYNQQYGNLSVQTNKKFHDRFMIIDGEETYHIGASLKDAGKKVFALTKMTLDVKDILK